MIRLKKTLKRSRNGDRKRPGKKDTETQAKDRALRGIGPLGADRPRKGNRSKKEAFMYRAENQAVMEFIKKHVDEELTVAKTLIGELESLVASFSSDPTKPFLFCIRLFSLWANEGEEHVSV